MPAHETMQIEARAVRGTIPDAPRSSLAALVRRFGGSVSTALLDERCRVFCAPGVEGAIGYRARLGCAVGIGDPVCDEQDRPRLAAAFREHCRARGWRTGHAVATPAFAGWAAAHGYAALCFGEELSFDPRRDPTAGAAGRELRKKLLRATREGVEVEEYVPRPRRDAALERAMRAAAAEWLAARTGPQVYVVPLSLFEHLEGRRWFYARHRGRIVGVLCTMRLDARRGYLLDHHVASPCAPIGTSEALAAHALRTFGREGCAWASFGPSASSELGDVRGLGKRHEQLSRAIFHQLGRSFRFDSRNRYRRKFQVAATERSYLLVAPARFGPRETAAFLSAFNVSMA